MKINSAETGVQLTKEHNHLPDFGSVKAMKLLANAKKRCIDEPHVLPSVVSQETFSNAALKYRH